MPLLRPRQSRPSLRRKHRRNRPENTGRCIQTVTLRFLFHACYGFRAPFLKRLAAVCVTAGLILSGVAGLCGRAVAESDAPTGRGSVRLEMRRVPSHAHVPNRWSQLPCRINNDRDEPFEGLCVTTVGDEQGLQYGRRVWVPPHTRFVTWQPLLVPDAPPADPFDPKIREIEFRSLLFDSRASDDQPVRQELGRLEIRDTLWLTHPGQVTGVLLPPHDGAERGDGDGRPTGISAYEFVVTGRVEAGIQYNYVVLDEGLPPGGEQSLEAFDQLIVASDTVLHDHAAIAALRDWLFRGGRLWIMLDRVDVSVLEVLLGDAFTGHVVDRVGLTRAHLRAGPLGIAGEEQPREFDRPVPLARLLLDDVDMAYTVDGWPAAYWKTCGEGRLLVTTLGPGGWVRPRLPTDDPPSIGGAWATSVVPGPAFNEIMSSFFVVQPDPLMQPEVLETQARDGVGYTVPSKGLVVGLLSGFTLFLIGMGAWSLRVGEGQRMGVIGPLAALVASLSLMAVGNTHRSVPEMTAVTQFVQPIPGTDDVRAIGAAATFVAETGPVEFSGNRGWLMPSLVGQDPGPRRVVWSDLDHWRWENLRLTQGLHAARFRNSAELDARTSARISFDSEGVTGRLSLPAGLAASDAIIVTPSGRMGVKMAGENTFQARAEDVFTAEQYVAAGLLSDEQATRSRTLATLLESSGDRFSREPTLLFWTDPWELGTFFPSETSVTGSALVTVPLEFDRPAVGTAIQIPSPFVTYREAMLPNTQSLSGLYNHRTRTWMERRNPTSTWLGFRLPRRIAPVRPTTAKLTIRVAGPMGRLEVATLRGTEPVPVKTWDDPVGTLAVELDDPQLLALAPDGTLMLRIAVGDPNQPASAQASASSVSSTFRIESLTLELQAVVLDHDEDSRTLTTD